MAKAGFGAGRAAGAAGDLRPHAGAWGRARVLNQPPRSALLHRPPQAVRDRCSPLDSFPGPGREYSVAVSGHSDNGGGRRQETGEAGRAVSPVPAERDRVRAGRSPNRGAGGEECWGEAVFRARIRGT